MLPGNIDAVNRTRLLLKHLNEAIQQPVFTYCGDAK
jgi:hypothetical protein